MVRGMTGIAVAILGFSLSLHQNAFAGEPPGVVDDSEAKYDAQGNQMGTILTPKQQPTNPQAKKAAQDNKGKQQRVRRGKSQPPAQYPEESPQRRRLQR